jgi:toxin ParE1/3/4
MAKYRVARPTEVEIRKILDWSEERFGKAARMRYTALIVAAMEAVAEDPEQAQVSWRRLAQGDIGIYRLSHSRDHVPDSPGPVREPRHAIVFRIAPNGMVDIIGIIHDRMLRGRALRKIVRSSPGEP